MVGAVKFARLFACVVCLAGLSAAAGCASQPPHGAAPDSASRPAALPAYADGLTFVSDGHVWTVGDGATNEVAPGGDAKRDVSRIIGGDGLAVTAESGQSAYVETVIPGDARRKRVHAANDASLLGSVRYDMSGGGFRLWASEFGDPATRLVVIRDGSGSVVHRLPLAGFSGEFDVDPSGKTVVYTGTGQNPAQLMVYSGSRSQALVAGFATVFTPSFSRDGGSVCFTGSRSPSDPLSVWVVDVHTKAVRAMAGTNGWKPTWPVFSPDGTRIAFRSGNDGSLWIAPLGEGAPQKLPLSASETALAW